ncbi:MAG: cob(I)yrinic acid a,c-diamide adenosyltransferase [Nitrospinota bacterium]
METKDSGLGKGYLQVYTGEGKGKSTAAFGLAIRAAGAGFKVFIAQFIKGCEYSELKAFERYADLITLKQYGRGCFIVDKPTDEDIRMARQGLKEVEGILASGEYQVVILDEANIATYYKLFTADELIEGIKKRTQGVEVIITGRYADPKVIDMADLVTEMREIKHYYNDGAQARRGIEK